eukprot:scaffold100_cov357-Prasinococcus_capsulatus_cf.AAC.8
MATSSARPPSRTSRASTLCARSVFSTRPPRARPPRARRCRRHTRDNALPRRPLRESGLARAVLCLAAAHAGSGGADRVPHQPRALPESGGARTQGRAARGASWVRQDSTCACYGLRSWVSPLPAAPLLARIDPSCRLTGLSDRRDARQGALLRASGERLLGDVRGGGGGAGAQPVPAGACVRAVHHLRG